MQSDKTHVPPRVKPLRHARTSMMWKRSNRKKNSVASDDLPRHIEKKQRDASSKKLMVAWNLKFTNPRKEQLFWRSILRTQNSSFSAIIFSVLFLFCIVRFVSGLIDASEIISMTEISERPLDCLNCIDGLCGFPYSNDYMSVPLPRPLDNSYRVMPNYHVVPMQFSTFDSDNVCPEDAKYNHALSWIHTLGSDNEDWIVNEIEKIQGSRGCDLLMSGFQDSRNLYNEDIFVIGIFLLILLMQVITAIWDHRIGNASNYDPWDSGYSYVEREQDKVRLKTRDSITKMISKKHRHFFDVADGKSGIEDDHLQRSINLQHKTKVFLCYTAYSISVFVSIFGLRGATRFAGGLLNNEECPVGEYDLNYASLYTKGINTGEYESIFTWSQHGFKYILGVAAIHFSGAVRFVTLLPISILFASIAMSVFFSFRLTAESRVAIVVLPFIHVLFLTVVYQVEYTERLMWDIQRTMHKTTISQRKVCEDMLPKTALRAILKDSLDLAYRNDHVTFLFSDIVGFTNFSDKVDAGQVLQLLQSLFVHFDFMVSYYGLFKVCTIGDAYVAITQPTNAVGRKKRNVTLEDISGFVNILQFGYTMLKRVTDVKQDLHIYESRQGGTNNEHHNAEGKSLIDLSDLAIRIGLHHGTCVGGIIGSGRIRYDIWGVDVLIGECMEQNGNAMELHVSDSWKNFYCQYPVTAILSTMTIEDADDFPIRDITFEPKGTSSLKVDGKVENRLPGALGPAPPDKTDESQKEKTKEEETHIPGYLLKPSWEDMVKRMKHSSGTKTRDGQYSSRLASFDSEEDELLAGISMSMRNTIDPRGDLPRYPPMANLIEDLEGSHPTSSVYVDVNGNTDPEYPMVGARGQSSVHLLGMLDADTSSDDTVSKPSEPSRPATPGSSTGSNRIEPHGSLSLRSHSSSSDMQMNDKPWNRRWG